MQRAPSLFDGVLPGQSSSLLHPTPLPGLSQMFDDFGQFVRSPPTEESPGDNRGNGDNNVTFHKNMQNIIANNEAEPPIQRTLFSPPSKFSHILRSLVSIHNAKSFVYSSNFFGLVKYYTEEFDFNKSPLHPRERRKIRFGLKSIVDFIIQLDLHQLRSSLLESDTAVEKFTT